MTDPVAGDIIMQFTAVVDHIAPPSVNHMYTNGMHGRRILTKEGEAYKGAMKVAVIEQTQRLDWKAAVDEVYKHRGYVGISILVALKEVFNPAWKPGGKTKPTKTFPKGNLQCPYQKVDAASYDKIIQDGVVLGTGIDDACHLWSDIRKIADPARPRVEILYLVYRGDFGH